MDNSKPAFCITNKEVTKINAAQPFILIVVQIGKTKRDTLGLAFKFCSAQASVTGKVPAELLVNKATARAGAILRKTLSGFKPRISMIKGKMIKN